MSEAEKTQQTTSAFDTVYSDQAVKHIAGVVENLFAERVNDEYGHTLNGISDALFEMGVLAMLSHTENRYEALLADIVAKIELFFGDVAIVDATTDYNTRKEEA